MQDAYSLRAVPQVHGASHDAPAYLERALEVEVASATDNPLVIPETGEVIGAGNFHGQPLVLPAGAAAVALAELADIAERRAEQMLNCAYGIDGFPNLAWGLALGTDDQPVRPGWWANTRCRSTRLRRTRFS